MLERIMDECFIDFYDTFIQHIFCTSMMLFPLPFLMVQGAAHRRLWGNVKSLESLYPYANSRSRHPGKFTQYSRLLVAGQDGQHSFVVPMQVLIFIAMR